MEFVDYKCLESLLIEGEDLIATEGIGAAFVSLIKGAFTLIGRVFMAIANIFRNIAIKLKGKKPVKKNSNNDLNKNTVHVNEPNKTKDNNAKNDSFEPAKKNPPSDEEAKKAADSIKQRYENSEQYKNHKSQSEDARKQIEEYKTPKTNKDQNNSNKTSSLHNDISAKLVFSKGDSVSKELNYLIDACSTIRNTVFSETEDYKDTVNFIEKHTNLLEENFKEFSDEVNKFKEEFEKNNKCMSASTRDDLCKSAIRRSEEYTSFAERCDKKLKNIFNVSKYQKEDVEEGNIDIQKVRAPAQKALSVMSKYANASIKIYNELNTLLVSAVIIE